jgi:hypothetical protein
MTIHVGLGDGGKAQQLAMFQMLAGAQEKLIAAGLVSKRNLFNSAEQLVKLIGRKDVESFFVPPDAQPDPQDPSSAPIQPPEDPKLIELQAKQKIEETQAQADIATQRDKTQMEAMLMREKHQWEMQRDKEQHEMKLQEMRMGMAAKLASSVTNKRSVGPDGETQESGTDTAAITAIIEAMNPKPVPMRMRKVGDGEWVKEPIQNG